MEPKRSESHACADCKLRKMAERNPKSLIGRFWFWHIKWCPGWKSYQKALAAEQKQKKMVDLIKDIDKSWTLFLDRDGVINVRPMNDYVKTWDEFEFLPGVLSAIKVFAEVFDRILIVTNQQGISKDLMTPRDLYVIHQNMMNEIIANGGRVDAIYYCPDRYNKPHHCRKPGVRMAKWAKRDFPEVEYQKSFMVGDTKNDMLFGRKLKMRTILIDHDQSEMDASLYDKKFPGLIDFSRLFSAID